MLPALTATILVLSAALAATAAWALFERRRSLRLEQTVQEKGTDLSALLHALPVPVWTRDAAGKLVSANKAFLALVGRARLEDAADSVLERSETDLFAEARETGQARVRRFIEVGGQRRSFEFLLRAVQGGETVAMARDVTEDSLAHSKLVLEVDAHRDVLDQLPIGVAVFGPDRRLLMLNRSFRKHYGLSEGALAETLYFEELLDWLRAVGRLPEQRDFATWKRRMVAFFDDPRSHHEEIWHLPNGRSERVTACPHLLGGLAFLVEDLTTELELQSAYNTIVKTQKATLDGIAEAVAVFGLDGRLRLHNHAFAKLWHLDDHDLAARPHVNQIASTCERRIGPDAIWTMVIAGVNVAEPHRYNSWDTVRRADGRVIALSLTRLPDGATMATFSDLTSSVRIMRGGRGRPAA